MNNILKYLNTHRILIFIWIIALFTRLYLINNQQILFFYDQARDFATVEKILQGDLKIQGPSASGTNDTIYHGVFYYYLIAPVQLISHGDPNIVAAYLGILGSFSIFIIYFLGLKIYKNKEISLVAAFFLAISYVHANLSTWLSNPSILSWGIVLFYYFVWKVFLSKNHKITDSLALSLTFGFCVQAGIFELYLIIIPLFAYILAAINEKKLFVLKPYELMLMLLVFLTTVSTMLATEYLLWKRGILNSETISLLMEHQNNTMSSIINIGKQYFQNFTNTIVPRQGNMLSIVFILLAIFSLIKSKRDQKTIILLVLIAPAFLLLLQSRDSRHLFAGLEIAYYLLIAYAVVWLKNHVSLGKAIGILITATVVLSNLTAIRMNKIEDKHYYAVQNGTFLNERLALIDKTYRDSKGNPFSISTLTIPYGINVTWSYLYHWYGEKKYGYLPSFFGPTQKDLIGENYLPEVSSPEAMHFVILESDTGIAESILQQFMKEQSLQNDNQNTSSFGQITLFERASF